MCTWNGSATMSEPTGDVGEEPAAAGPSLGAVELFANTGTTTVIVSPLATSTRSTARPAGVLSRTSCTPGRTSDTVSGAAPRATLSTDTRAPVGPRTTIRPVEGAEPVAGSLGPTAMRTISCDIQIITSTLMTAREA